MFSFIIYDRKTGNNLFLSKSRLYNNIYRVSCFLGDYFAVRDHVGITPLYIGYGADGSVWIASEMKSLSTECARFEVFLPG